MWSINILHYSPEGATALVFLCNGNGNLFYLLSPRPSVDRLVCMSAQKVYCGKMDEWIQMPFGVGWGMCVLDWAEASCHWGTHLPRHANVLNECGIWQPILPILPPKSVTIATSLERLKKRWSDRWSSRPTVIFCWFWKCGEGWSGAFQDKLAPRRIVKMEMKRRPNNRPRAGMPG